jgi:hypothetical protein
MVPIALILSAAVATGTILFGRGAELQDPVARATATYMPEIRTAEAELRRAEANMRSPDLQVAKSKAEALEVKATTTEMEALEKKIDRLRTDLLGTTRNPLAMSSDLAAAMLELETAKNNAVTPELAEARIRLKVLDDLALTEEVQRARDKIELLNNKIQSIPQAAAAFVETEKLLEAASTPALLESRRHRENLLSEAQAKNSDASRALARLGEVKARVVSQELTESRQRLEQERAAARSGR